MLYLFRPNFLHVLNITHTVMISYKQTMLMMWVKENEPIFKTQEFLLAFANSYLKTFLNLEINKRIERSGRQHRRDSSPHQRIRRVRVRGSVEIQAGRRIERGEDVLWQPHQSKRGESVISYSSDSNTHQGLIQTYVVQLFERFPLPNITNIISTFKSTSSI